MSDQITLHYSTLPKGDLRQRTLGEKPFVLVEIDQSANEATILGGGGLDGPTDMKVLAGWASEALGSIPSISSSLGTVHVLDAESEEIEVSADDAES